MKSLQLIATMFSVLAMSMGTQAQNAQVNTSQSNGLTTVKMTTEAGEVYVHLPQLSQGATISGTVEIKPQGKNKLQEEKNGAYLNGVVVELKGADKKTNPGRGLFYAIPVAATAVVGFIKDHSGKTLGVFDLPVTSGTHPQIPASQFNIPSIAQTGEPFVIGGPSDGNLSNTFVRLDGQTYTPLAESTDGIYVRPNPDVTGPTHIDAADNGVMTSGTTNLINIRLSAGNLNLQRGQTTHLDVTVSGLEGLDKPVIIMLRNETPQVVELGGGNQQIFEAPPGQYEYTYTTTVRALQTGSFSVSAAVVYDEDQDNQDTQPDQTGNDRPTYQPNNNSTYYSPADILMQQAGNNNANKQNAQAKNPTCNCDQITAKITIENISRKQRLEENLARTIEDIKRVYLQLQNQNLNNQQRADLDKKLATLSEQKKELEDKLKNKVYEEERTVEQDISSSIAQNGDNVWIKVRVSNVDSKVCDCAVPKDCAFLLEYIDGFSKVANPLDSFDSYYKAEFNVTQNNPYLDFTVGGKCIKPGCDDSATKEKKFQITFKLN